jgi:ABC-type lipoprotein export system ATPase subunit
MDNPPDRRASGHRSAGSGAAVDVDRLRFAYPDGPFAMAIESLRVGRGERVAIIGPSGCGKTTLLNLLAGLLVPLDGRLTIADVELSRLGDEQRRRFRISRLGMVFQSFALVEYLSVFDNLVHCFRISGALRLTAEVREKAEDLAAGLGLGDKLRRRVGHLSQGERQRVAIGRALLSDPDLLLTDEATGNLDPGNKGRILDLLFDRMEPGRSTLVSVTHDHELLDRFDRVIDYRELGSA